MSRPDRIGTGRGKLRWAVRTAFQIAAGSLPEKGVSWEVEDTRMTILLDSTFATAEDTAKALGVSKTRLKRIVRLMQGRVVASGRTNGNKAAHKNGARILTSTRKRKNARGKVKKVAR